MQIKELGFKDKMHRISQDLNINVCKMILKHKGQGEYIPVNISGNPSYLHFSYLALDKFEVKFRSFISFGHLKKCSLSF